MGRAVPAYLRLPQQLRIQSYHVYMIAFLACVILVGTCTSALFRMNHYNERLSATRATDYAAFVELQRQVPSLLADRRNWMNTLFVKRAWFWNTLAMGLIAATLKRTGGGVQGEMGKVPVPARVRSWHDVVASKTFVRWLIATIGWFLVAQWSFGASLLERMHVASGGQCLVNAMEVDPTLCRTRAPLSLKTHPHLLGQLHPTLLERHSTLHAGWHGGVNVSGHTFILVLSLLVLGEMLVPYVPVSWAPLAIPTAVRSQRNVRRDRPPAVRPRNQLVLLGTLALMALWTGMLCATSMYYHTAVEKAAGFFTAIAVWLLVPKETALV